MVAEAVGGGEVVFRLAGGHGAYHFFECLVVGEGEEHRLDVGVVDADVLHAVFFLVAAGKLVLFDAAFHIVVNERCYHDAVLCAAVHGLGVDVVVFLLVLHQPAVAAECGEVLHGFVVDLGGVFVGTRGEVYFRLYDMVKRFGVAFGFCAGFFAVEHVVGARCDFCHHLARGADASEGFDFGHFS